MNQYTAHPMPEKYILEHLYYEKDLTQVEVGRVFNVSQKVVFGWFKKLGVKSRVAKKRDQRGDKNSSWKGDIASYEAFHKRVYSLRGSPSVCEECGTTESKNYDWANITGKYEDVNDYKRMCRSCHAKYDNKVKNITVHRLICGSGGL
jgi:hypothetical protein